MNYKIIADLTLLTEFVNMLEDCKPNEQYYVTLFARAKYLRNTEYEGLIKSDKSALKSFTSIKESLIDKIKQLECEIGTYKDWKTKNPIPQESLALYITFNPRDLRKAGHELAQSLNKDILNGKNVNPHKEALKFIQCSSSKRKWYDFDLDIKDIELAMKVCSFLNPEATEILQTRGGYHILINLSKIKDEYKKTWFKSIKDLGIIDQKFEKDKDIMTPVPGTYQGGFIPHFIKQ